MSKGIKKQRLWWLKVLWFIKSTLTLILIGNCILCICDLATFVQREDGQGANHRILVILTFAITFIFIVLMIILLTMNELCGLIIISIFRITIMIYDIWENNRNITVISFATNFVTIALLLLYVTLHVIIK